LQHPFSCRLCSENQDLLGLPGLGGIGVWRASLNMVSDGKILNSQVNPSLPLPYLPVFDFSKKMHFPGHFVLAYG
jgi:hypothetical protein